MLKSKLESYQQILETLADKPQTLERLSVQTNTDYPTAKRHINFLKKNGLIQEHSTNEQILHAVTEKGAAVLKALTLQKRLDKARNALTAADQTVQAMPTALQNIENTE